MTYRDYLLRPLSLWARYWPQLAACYLLGLLGRQAHDRVGGLGRVRQRAGGHR